MRIPAIRGVIDRRILVNYHVDPDVVRRILPRPFRPKLAHDHAIAGVCLIRLRDIRPSFLSFGPGIRSENAAHRIAVEWDEHGIRRDGVFIPRRDTDSRINALVGGRLFPGRHHLARFLVDESDAELSVSLESRDRQTSIAVRAHVCSELPDGSVFSSLPEASEFFETGAIGYSVTDTADRFDGLELRCHRWEVEPLRVSTVTSSFFDDAARFPPDSIQFDSALLMRGIEHEWHSCEQLSCGSAIGRFT